MPKVADIGHLDVYLGDDLVGRLAVDDDRLACFEYSSSWLANGFSISPFSLPLERRLFRPDRQPFDGLFGVFSDSLPDGWGRLLVDRTLREQGIDPAIVDELTRLAIVGSGGMGALRYEPAFEGVQARAIGDFDELAASCRNVLENQPVSDLDELLALGGSSGGARPKALIEIDGESWIVKFPSRFDSDEAGRLEYAYAECARECGLRVPRTRLFPSKLCDGYFGARRFDRDGAKRIHMASAGGLLESSHRYPVLDYRALMQVTFLLAGDMRELDQMFRLMCFNVFSHNQDDHAKNFSFLCDGGQWRLAPAYDLTYGTTFANEHATTVNGKGNPEMEDLIEVASEFELPARSARIVAESIRDACHDLLMREGLE